MDYEGEQEMELEALEAIFMDDIQVYEGTAPPEWTSATLYKIVLTPLDDGEDLEDDTPRLEFLFQHTEKYPDEAPNVRIRSLFGLNDSEVAEAQSNVEEAINENMGMAMVFSLIEVAKEWLKSKAEVDVDDNKGLSPEEIRKREEEKEEEELRAQRSMGTPVTRETFEEWKTKFDEEQAMLKLETSEVKTESKPGPQGGKMTGKAWFMMQDHLSGRVDEGDVDFLDVDSEEDIDDEEDDFVDYDDDDDDGMADEYLVEKSTG